MNLSDISAVTDKAAPARDIFDVEHFSQLTWQFKTKNKTDNFLQ